MVLRRVEFSETSLIVTLLSRDMGRVSAMAKGARRLKGPFEGSLDLLSVCRVVVIQKHGDTLDLLTEAKLIRRFRGGERALDRTYAGYYLAEMLRLLTDDRDPDPELYDLALQTLNQIDGVGNVEDALIHFDAQSWRILGLAPGTSACTACGGEIPQQTRLTFSLTGGGLVCPSCRVGQSQCISVRSDVIDSLDRLLHCETRQPISIAPPMYGELRSLMNRYVQTLLGKVPRMQPYLPTAIRTEPSG